ncbi:hypothetical protein BRADI_3g14320v3 [Brachypodium distachyon]|uniref:Uncharacterized protein n=1 Tax=Brachypodium distachyon TaxID=15368 RepID=A0A2K2CX35_BRADI|nr:hypothetical protein BRADI_3g14320v3 [Brachypodium distachyon]
MMFSCFRLSFQGFGDTTQSHQDINLNPVLSLFYGLVLVQAVLSFFEFAHSYPSLDLTGINAHYKFTGSRDKQLELYYVHVRTLCRGGDIRKIINMTLISFAVESLGSDERDLHSAGIKILHSLIHTQLHDYSREQALSRIQNSPDVIEHLFKVITRTRIEDRPERARATLIIAKLAGNLCVSGFPYAMHSLRSLLETSDEDAIVTEESNNIDVNLVLKGLEILQQLACNTCNFTAISNADEIMLKITKFTRYNPAMTAIDFEKARNSLQLLSRLAGNIGKQGAMIRQVISNNVFLLSKIREILLQDPTNDQQLEGLQSLAVKIIESFALDSKAGTCKTITGILTLLLDIFSESLPPVSDLGLNAGKALGKLTMESRTHCDVILNTEGNLQTLRNMLFNEEQHTDYRVTVANILKNLVAYGETTNIVRDFAVTNLKMVVNRANETQGADLEAYLSLVVELSKLKPATNFNIAVVFADCPTFVGKLIETVAEANIADDRCPGIRRLAVEQAIWMMRHDDDLRCKQHFVGMQALRRVPLLSCQDGAADDPRLALDQWQWLHRHGGSDLSIPTPKTRTLDQWGQWQRCHS